MWTERAAFVVVPALPGLAWAGLARLMGLQDAFFRSASTESPVTRAGATIGGMAAHLAVAPVDLAVLLVGCWFLRRDRGACRLRESGVAVADMPRLARNYLRHVCGRWA